MASLTQMAGNDKIELRLSDGKIVQVNPIGLWHLQKVEEKFSRGLKDEDLKSTRGLLALVTALLDEGEHLKGYVTDKATWDEREKVVSRLISFDELSRLGDRMKKDFPSEGK